MEEKICLKNEFQETLEESQDSGCGSGNDTQVSHMQHSKVTHGSSVQMTQVL